MLRLFVLLLAFLFADSNALALDLQEQKSPVTAARIHWQTWSDEAFAQATREHKLVILDLEAVWCHWCHVMDEKTYSDPAVARLIASKYIAVRVDQDSRPDLSNKYQDYGWPATIIFDSQGKELAKRAGFIDQPAMTELLSSLAKKRRPEENAHAAVVHYAAKGTLPAALRQTLIAGHNKGYDTKYGAWSFGQKFMDADSEEYALTLAKEGNALEAKRARQTLDEQLHLLDKAWGGVYQYSTHGDWDHPHFEKIMPIQADNMRIYALGYLYFHDPRYLNAAKAIYSYLTTFLLNPDGAFYVSQDADIVPGQHGDAYFRLNNGDRRKQGIPRIDKHQYARENGWAISGITELYNATGDRNLLLSASRAADWVVANRALDGGGFKHDEQNAAGPYLGDTLFMGRAFLNLYEATADRRWLKRAEQAADFIGAHFKQDNVPGLVTAVAKPGAIAKPEPLLDENVAAVRFLNLLSHYDGSEKYKQVAQSAMRFVAAPEVASRHKIFVGGILLADRELHSDPVHMTIVGGKEDARAATLFQAALKYPVSYKQVEWYDQSEGELPSGAIGFPPLKEAAAFACAFERCSLPIYKPELIARTVDAFKR